MFLPGVKICRRSDLCLSQGRAGIPAINCFAANLQPLTTYFSTLARGTGVRTPTSRQKRKFSAVLD
jgi:hypothetical protein